MDFHADDDLPIAGRTFDQFLSIGLNGHNVAHLPLKIREAWILHLVAVHPMRGKFRQFMREALAARFSKAELLSMQTSTSNWPKFRNDFCQFSHHDAAPEPRASGER